MDAQFQFKVKQQQAGQLLLSCLETSIPYLQPEQWNELLINGKITLNGGVITSNPLLHLHDEVAYAVPNYEEPEVDTAWKLLWHNEHIAAIHKPANLPVSRTTRNVYNTLIQLLRRESPWPDAHLLHRLDLETSGIILIAQNNEQAKIYQPKLSQLMLSKRYRAIVHGEPSWQTLEHESYLNTKPDSPIRCQMHLVEKGQGKLSQTRFKKLATTGEYSLIECELLTGRKHQIRAHLAGLGYPIVGDKIYSEQGGYYLKRLNNELTQEDLNAWLCDHHLLHAHEVHLNPLWDNTDNKVEVKNPFYSAQWRRFCERVNLPAC